MSHAYTEDQLVEQPAIGLVAALGWQTISALEETFGTAGTLGRETKSEVVLVERLRIALTKLADCPWVLFDPGGIQEGGRTIYPTAVTRTGGAAALTVIRRCRCAYRDPVVALRLP